MNRRFIAAGEGEIVQLKLTCDKEATPGTFDIAFSGISLSCMAGSVSVNQKCNDFTVPLTLKKISSIPGDADGNFTVNVTDVMVIVDYVLGRSTDLIFNNADMDKNGEVNITDAMNVVNIILGNNKANAPADASMTDRELLCLASIDNNCQISTAADMPTVTALQMDVVLPTGCRLTDSSLTGFASKSHQMVTRQMDDSRYRIVIYSNSGTVLHAGAPLLNLNIVGDTDSEASIDVVDIQCTERTDDGSITILSPDMEAVATNIRSTLANEANGNAPLYNISGQRVTKPYRGISISNKKKKIFK